jgi:hypothetical protein
VGQQPTTNPGARLPTRPFPLSIDSRLARLELPNTTCTCSLFCTVFPAIHSILHLTHWGSTCTNLLKYNLLESTGGSLLPNAGWPFSNATPTLLSHPAKFSYNLLAGLSLSSQEDLFALDTFASKVLGPHSFQVSTGRPFPAFPSHLELEPTQSTIVYIDIVRH